ncbi:cell division protein FtsK [Mycobacteroides abscessus subsp. abscessus]|uniref:FtsK/SpoIIIE domain-containing protein n=1 Tax=Mycobacteroides abscessus TaxID=36809 RepID=UPI000927A624|nr:FtsK/SpoIIIE domain-containing protein [Mycobacteroides abscessus]SIJ21739.1 cell division protein FtsK [Mycobacteroides abscessus subsp. abscessus]SLH38829.1 cell division protein FtsK [Mycobacteroides abscessus subsp. abscessus]
MAKHREEVKAPPEVAPVPKRAFATHTDELQRPYMPEEAQGPAQKEEVAKEWRLLVLVGLGAATVIGYAQVWPRLHAALYRPSPLRDWLLPASPRPMYVVAGVGVGWFWLIFLAVPAVLAVLAALWSAAVAMSNRRARKGHLGHVRPGQEWVGEQFGIGPILVGAAALMLFAAGVLLRWTAPAIGSLLVQLLLAAVLAVAVAGYVQLVMWARARSAITGLVNRIGYLSAPTLAWTDLRSGRVKVLSRAYPRKAAPFPKVLELLYGQHPRHLGDEQIAEVEQLLALVTGHTYRVENVVLAKKLRAVETVIPDEETAALDAEAVLAPLVASWFDASASIVNVAVADPDAENGDAGDEVASEVDPGDTVTDRDHIAGRVREFTVEFAYSIKVQTSYRRGLIESAVSDALRGSWEAEWSMVSRRVRFVRCPGLPRMVPPNMVFPKVTRGNIREIYKKAVLPFAVDAYGNEIAWDYRVSPHLLLCGPTSTGKTSLLMTLALRVCGLGFPGVWIDPKGFDSPGLRGWPNMVLVTAGFDDDGMVGHTAALRWIADTMRERYAQVKANPNKADDFDPIFVFTDEFSNLIMELGKFFLKYRTKADKGRPPTEEDVGTILRTARAVGIHMVIGLQRPDVAFISGEARDNTSMRVAMGRLRSKEAAIMMFNDPVAGTRLEPGIKGRGTVQLPDNSFREIQVYYTPLPPATDEQRASLNDDERKTLGILGAVERFWPRMAVKSVLRDCDLDRWPLMRKLEGGGDQLWPVTFADIRDSEIVPATEHPELDLLSDEYVSPTAGFRKPTLDDHLHAAAPPVSAGSGADEQVAGAGSEPVIGSSFGAPVDGFDDEYLPDVDDEYGPAIPVAANELQRGDLVDVSVDGVGTWKYIHAEPYLSDDDNDDARLIIPYRDIGDSQEVSDIDVDPNEVFQARQLHMQ